MPQYGVPATARSMSLNATAVNIVDNAAYIIKGIYIFNSDSATIYVKFYKSQGAGVSSTCVLTVGVASGGSASIGLENGLFVTQAGLSVRAVTEIADSGTTPATENKVVCTVFYSKA